MSFRPIVGESGITYKVESKEGIISTMSNGWKKELNKVAWNDGEAKFEIRSWSKDLALWRKSMIRNGVEIVGST